MLCQVIIATYDTKKSIREYFYRLYKRLTKTENKRHNFNHGGPFNEVQSFYETLTSIHDKEGSQCFW